MICPFCQHALADSVLTPFYNYCLLANHLKMHHADIFPFVPPRGIDCRCGFRAPVLGELAHHLQAVGLENIKRHVTLALLGSLS